MYRAHSYEFGNQLLLLRTRVALTQIALAEQLGVHRRSVQNWETGVSYPKAETLQRLIAAFLRQHAFTPGNERAEAQALWEQAAQDGSHAPVAFDEVWFARTLALHSASPATTAAPATTADITRAMIDWGEAIAVPTLVGRDDEIQTLQQWIVDDRCRVVAVVGIGGIGKSSLAITLAQRLLAQFDVVLFRSVQNAPLLAEVLDHVIRAVSGEHATPPDDVADKIALLVQLFRERRCLLILDNLEAIMQPGELTGTYRDGYAEYGTLLQRLSEREHGSCLLLTSREKPAELGPFEGRNAPVRSLPLSGLDDSACRSILEAKDIVGTPAEITALARLYGGNPLALMLVREPIRELFGGDVGAFLGTGDAFFNGVGTLMAQQCARSTPLERAIMFWLAIERELVPLSVVLADLGDAVAHGDVLNALESLRRRTQIERGPDGAAFTLQPVILEFVTEQVVETIRHEIVDGLPRLLQSHALIQATAKEYIRRSQERLLATPLLERLISAYGSADAVERRLLTMLAAWRKHLPPEQGYGPGNIVNLLHLLRGDLRGLDLAHLSIRQAYLQDVDVQDTRLTGALLADSVFTETFDAVASVAVSSGDAWAAGSRRGEVLLWTAGGRTLHRAWQAHSDMVRALAFSPDGRTLVTSGSWDGTLKLWDVASGALLWLGRHPSYTNIVAFAPDGSMLASSGNDAAIRLWEPRNGTQLQTLPHPEPMSAVAWSPDGRLLASGDVTGGVRLWRIHRTEPAICVRTLVGHTAHVDGLAFAPDGKTLASASWDGTVKLWEVADGKVRQTLTAHTQRVVSVAWSPDGRTLASAGRDRTIWLWDIEPGDYRAALRAHTGEVNGLAFTPDSRSLLSSSEDGTLRVWDVASGQCLRTIQGYASSLCDIAWSPDGARLVSGGTDTLVTIFDVAAGMQPRVLRGHTGVVIGVGWSSGNRYVASSEWNNAIRLWDAASGACLQILQHPDDTGNFFDGLAWSPDGQRLAGGTYRHGALVWDISAGHTRLAALKAPTWIRHVAWSPDGRHIAGGGADGSVYVWDAAEGRLLHRLAGHHSSISGVAWRPDGAQLASGSSGPAGGELFVWDMQRGERVHALVGDSGMIYALAWGSSKDVLVSGGGDGMLRWWDVQRGSVVVEREAHHGTVQALRRSPDGNRLASCGDDGAIVLWDLHGGANQQTLRRDRPYERLDITGLTGITHAQRASLLALGAVDLIGERQAATGYVPSIASAARPAVDQPQANGERQVALGLPFQPTPFIGRVGEIAELTKILRDPACRLLTLTGPGGIGKTRLALEVAAGQAGAYADGVAFVPLASAGTPNQIVPAIGEALGLSAAGQPDPTAHVLDSLRERHMLLVLDDFEHLLAGADLVYDILDRVPRVSMLITSRERLNLQAEWLFDVEGLAYPPEDPYGSGVPRSVADLTAYSAIQLFVQRATQIQPGLALSEATLSAIVAICRQVAGMPLAIELAAAGVRAVPPAEIERQIGSNLDVLATTRRDVPARHRSLRAVFEHSWHLLNEVERFLLSRLGVFRGGWTANAAGQVVGATLSSLTTLIDKSLVRQGRAKPQSSADLVASGFPPVGSTAEPRFYLPEPIREYALEQLAVRGKAEALQRAHATYYLALAEAAAEHWDSPTSAPSIEQLDREYDNMRAALQWARDGGDHTLGLRLAGALRKFWRRRGAIGEGRAWLEELLALDGDRAGATAVSARLRAMEGAAWLASDQHDYARAAQLFEQSMALRRALGETEDATHLLVNAAIQARAAGQYQRSIALLDDVVARQRALGDRGSISSSGLGLSLFLSGLAHREQGDVARATALFDECVELHRAIGDDEGIAVGLLGLSDIARDRGDAAQVRAYGEESLARLRKLGVEWAIGFALNNLALAAYLEGDLTHALALVSESVALFRGQKADGSLAEVLITLGQIMQARGDSAAAYEAFAEALRIAWAVGPRLLVAAAMEGLGGLAAQGEHAVHAVRLLGAASTLRTQMGTPLRQADQPALEHALVTAQSTLGPDTVAVVWREAQERPLDQILSTITGAASFDALLATGPPR